MDGRKIFITGAASGIGLETAQLFAKQGWRVGLCDRDKDGLDKTARELGLASSVHVADVVDADELGGAIAKFCAGSALDLLFNCAGIIDMRRFADTPLDKLHAIIDVNVKGVINGIYQALPHLHLAADPRIVTMSSAAAIYGVPEEAAYSASKFAVRALTEALNIELAGDGIWVCDVMVAYVHTPMVEAAPHVAGSVGILGVNVAPEQVAAIVYQAAENRRIHWFVTDADAAVAAQVDATPWEERAAIMRSIAGF